ncbi:TIR domain-containing protein [Psychrilyobacter atlanticus]|uniref:TIR domain-containing protein n=1 Tax=Psychrilyobacter atlanticus TaxID=271091 RepID=UPI00042364B2|nr:TIR domain-containing protein [Psychrilyobacter atlanticus]
MAGTSYRTGTYVAFDGNGEKDPVKSDFRCYGLIKAWNKSDKIDFRFTDSHEKTYKVKDGSLKRTLETRLKERFSRSKNMVILLSADTNWDRGALNWEIEQAVDVYDLPIIIVYIGYKYILKPEACRKYWPKSLAKRIDNDTAKCIHIPFKKEPLFTAVNQFTVQNQELTLGVHYYNAETYEEWGLK